MTTRIEQNISPFLTAEEITYWVFGDKDVQIGAFSKDGAKWRATKMDRGMPTAQRYFETKDEAQVFASSPWGKAA